MRRGLLLLMTLCALADSSASAQAVRWDSLGAGQGRNPGRTDLRTIVVQPGPQGDTLFATEPISLYRLEPEETLFGPRVNETINPSPQSTYAITAAGTHITSGTGARGVSYSADGGVTWLIAEMVLNGQVDGSIVNGFFESASLGVLGAGQGGFLWQSTDDGRTWTVRHDFEIGFQNAYAVRELRGDTRPGAEASPWAGRLVMGFRGPIRYSDDQGTTWTEVALPVTDDWHEIEEAPDGTLYLGGVFGTFLYASDDGGASWREVAHFRPGAPIDVLDEVPENLRIAVAPDGALWVGVTALNGTREREGTFIVTRDGGRTWTEAAAGYGGYGVNDLTFDSAGRLIAATQVGVWRTAEPVVVVSAEEPPGKPSEAGLGRPYPNPTTGMVTVPLSLESDADVSVVVYDVLGRAVATLASGRVEAGQHAFEMDTADLAPGVYVVRAEGLDAEATHTFTVAR